MLLHIVISAAIQRYKGVPFVKPWHVSPLPSKEPVPYQAVIEEFVAEEGTQNRNTWLRSPVGNAPISSEFLSTRDCTGCSNTHGGTDYAVPVGTSVVATAPGIVVRAYHSNTYGNVVIINHGTSAHGTENVYTLYAHGDSLQIQQGANVNTGHLVIYSGNTGRSTGPHVHYEVIVTSHTPFESQFFGDLQIRHAPTDLGYFLGY